MTPLETVIVGIVIFCFVSPLLALAVIMVIDAWRGR